MVTQMRQLMRQTPWRRSWMLWGAVPLLGYFAISVWRHTQALSAWDFAVNWTAAQGLGQGISLYDREGLRHLGEQLIGPQMNAMFRDPFTSYIGPPSTALLYLPFTPFSFEVALLLYRVALLVAFGLSIYLAGLALPLESRVRGWGVGALAFAIFDPVALSFVLGQVDAWVLLGLALGVWASSRERWWLCGVGIGIAAVLKISPALLILYMFLRGKNRAVIASLLTVIALLAAGSLAAKPGDLALFLGGVATSVAGASLHTQNQSLPAWLARLILPNTDLLTFTIDIGVLRYLSIPIALGFAVFLAMKMRKEPFRVLELGLMIMVALVAGPLTWDHYTSWAIIALVLLSDARLWVSLTEAQRRNVFMAAIMGSLLLAIPTPYFGASDVVTSWIFRLASGEKTMGLLLLLTVSYTILSWSRQHSS
jgi:hypothetical protein